MLFCKSHSQHQDQGQLIYTCIQESCSLKFKLFCGYCATFGSTHAESSCSFVQLKTKVDLFYQMNYLKEFQDIWNDLKGNIIKPIDQNALVQKLKENQEITENDQAKELCQVSSQLLREKISINIIENHENQDKTAIINHSQTERSCQQFQDNLQDVRNKLDNQYFLMNVMEKNKRSSYRCVSQSLREINKEQNQSSSEEQKINSNVVTDVQSSAISPKRQQQDQMISLEQLISEFNISISILNRYLKWLKDLEQQFLKNLCSWYWRLHGLEISHVNKETKELRIRLRSHSLMRTTLLEISKHLRQLQLNLSKEQEKFLNQTKLLRKTQDGKTDDNLELQELNQIELSHFPFQPKNSYYDMLQTLPAHLTNILRHLRSIQINEKKEFKKRNIKEYLKEGKESTQNCLQPQFSARINTNERQFKELPKSKSKQKIFSNLLPCSSSSSYLPNYLTKWSFDGQVLVTVSQSASSANTQIIKIMQFPQKSKEQPTCIVNNNIASLENIETLQIASKRINDVSLSNSENYLGVALAEGYLLLIKRSPQPINLNESIINRITQNPIEINKISVNSSADEQQLQQGSEAEISPTNCNRVACKLKGNYKKIEFILSRNLICCLSAGSPSHCLIFDYSQNSPVIQISMLSLSLEQERQQFLQGSSIWQQNNELLNTNEFRNMSIYSGLIYPTVILQTNTSVVRFNLNIVASSSHRINHSRTVFEEEFSLAIPSPDESYLLLVSQKYFVLKQRKVQGNTNLNDQEVVNGSAWQLKWQYAQNQTDQAKQFEFSNDSSELYFLYDHRLVLLHIRFLHYYKQNESNCTQRKGIQSMENTPYLTELYYDKSIKLKSFFISADNSLIHLVTDTESIITLQKADRPGIF